MFGLNFADKTEVWQTDLEMSWSGVNDLVVGDTNGDGLAEILTFGSQTYDGRVHVMDGRTGAVKAIFR